jgi:hypothetical protein
VLRLQRRVTFRPTGQRRQRADTLVPGPNHAWVGAGTAFKERGDRGAGTLVVVWEADQAEPWVLLTDLPPEGVGPAWYGLGVWVELGFRALKGVGWQWTRRTEPDRVARHWLVLAVATVWVVATGTREEDAARPRTVSIFGRGLLRLRWHLLRVRRLWRTLWRWPEPWPDLAATVPLTVAASLPS